MEGLAKTPMQRCLPFHRTFSTLFFSLSDQKKGTMSGLVQCLLGMGNPLLDVMSNVDQAFLDKYGVRLNSLWWTSKHRHC